MDEVLARVAKDASRLLRTAPDYFARETWRQKTTTRPAVSLKLRMADGSLRIPELVEVIRETVSLYSLTPFHKSPES